MNREKSLVKNTLIITIGKICTQMITFFLLPLYTGILSTGEYGIIDLLNTLVSLMLPIVTFQIEQAVFRELIEQRESIEEKNGIISSSFFTIIIQCFLYTILFALISPFIKNDYKIFLITNVFAYIFSSYFLQVARGLGDNKNYAIGSFLSALSTIIFNIVFLVIIKLGASGMLLGTFIGQLTATLYIVIKLNIFKYIRIKNFDKNTVKLLWKYSIPLIPNAISWWVFHASDRVIASGILGVDQNGILAAALKFSSVYITLYNIFNMSWTESIAMAAKDKDLDKYFNKMFNTVIRLFTSMAIGIIACMPFIYPIMINKNYHSGYGLVPISLLASLFNVVVGLVSVIYIANKNTKAIANTSIISAIINIIVHLLLIKFIGLYAAVISTLTSFLIMSIYRIIDVKKRYFIIKIEKEIIIKTLIILPFILISYYINNLFLNIMGVIIAILFAWNFNKKSIGTILELIKKKVSKKQEV